MTATDANRSTKTEAEVAATMSYVEGILGMAGHAITGDGRARVERVARGEITGDEAIAEELRERGLPR